MEQQAIRVITRQAPVLIVPNVVSADLCKELISLWEAKNEAAYMMEAQADGSLAQVYDTSMKSRRDHFVEDPTILGVLKQRLADAVCPEIYTAFRFEVTRFEDFRIGCYDAESGGYFRPHRDDSVEGTYHRLFGLSFILNSGKYDGGCLRFPESSPDLYHGETGSAVVFSGHLLHEVTPVTSGRRFSLVSFLYGERESVIRKEYYSRQLLGQDAQTAVGNG